MSNNKKNTPVLQDKEPSLEKSPEAVAEEKYYEVHFLDRQNEKDLEYIPLGVNGELIQVQCGADCIIPQRFLEVADHAVIDKYRKGKKVGSVSRAPYRILREATKAEYLKMKQEGTAKHKDMMEEQSRASERQDY
jgi:hypothetical protein